MNPAPLVIEHSATGKLDRSVIVASLLIAPHYADTGASSEWLRSLA